MSCALDASQGASRLRSIVDTLAAATLTRRLRSGRKMGKFSIGGGKARLLHLPLGLVLRHNPLTNIAHPTSAVFIYFLFSVLLSHKAREYNSVHLISLRLDYNKPPHTVTTFRGGDCKHCNLQNNTCTCNDRSSNHLQNVENDHLVVLKGLKTPKKSPSSTVLSFFVTQLYTSQDVKVSPLLFA